MLVGRSAEITWLRERVGKARRGQGCAILLTGEPGAGKTALIQEICARPRRLRVLRVSGVESELNLGFSVLADLLKPLLGLLDRVPGPQAAALESALALAPPAGLDQFAVFAGTLSLLAAGAERGPLLVCVDDAHWIDTESARALAFCARRIYAEPVVIMLAARADQILPFDPEVLEQLAISGLDRTDAGLLLRTVSATEIAAAVADRLHAATAGNPLALIELSSLLTREQLEGRAELADPLPVGAGIERMFWRRIARQPPELQRALLVVAASSTGELQEVRTALSQLEISTTELDSAEAAGLIVLDTHRILFSHPLLRAAVYWAASAPERRTVHRALAEAVTGRQAPLRRAWHRAIAATAPDDRVAEDLARAGMEMAGRAGLAAASSALIRAAMLSTSEDVRAGRLLAAGSNALLAGMPERARELSAEALACTDDPRLQADCARLRGSVEIYAGNTNEAYRLLRAAADSIAAHDRARETQLLTDATIPLVNAGNIRAALEVAERACHSGAEVGGQTMLLAQAALGAVLILRGKAPRGYPMVLDALDVAGTAPGELGPQLMLQWASFAATWVEDYDRATTILSRATSALRAASALTPLPVTLAAQAELQFRTGQWNAALAGATEAVSIANETSQRATAGFSLVTLARIEAAIGRERASYEHGERALSLQTDTHSIRTYAAAALGLLELGLSRPEKALEHLAPLPALVADHGLREPGVAWWQPDWIEANIRVGQSQQASEALMQLERTARELGRLSALAAAARYRGMLAGDDEFETHFARSIALHERTPTPFERARTELCFGERLRRSGERRRAREHAGRALLTFQQLGAGPWIQHAQRERQAAGSPRRPTAGVGGTLPQDLLTAQELQVALAVARGATNKEVAAELFLSAKTIEFHLGHIYRKLNIRSRTQLARTMLAGALSDLEDPSATRARSG